MTKAWPAALLAVPLSLAACGFPQGLQPPDLDPAPRSAQDGALRLRLSAEPIRGEAPLTVRFEARLEGEMPQDTASLDCPTVAWILDARDDGQVVIAQAEGCREGMVPRVFRLEHTYEEARAYDTHARLLAVDLPPSNNLQVLVEGPTPTPGPRREGEGPAIVLATRAAGPAPTEGVGRPAADAGGEPTPAPSAQAVLPADLFFLSGTPGELWRLPASGAPPTRLGGDEREIRAYAVNLRGMVAYTGPRGLHLDLPSGGGTVLGGVAPTGLLWSRDGRRLAYGDPAVRVLDADRLLTRDLGLAGRPLTFSADGRWLLVAGQEDGAAPLVALDLDAEPPGRVELPIAALSAAGRLPDRDALWLAGAGLQLLSLGEPFSLRRLLPVDQRVLDAFARPDGRILVRREGDPSSPGSTPSDLARVDLESGDVTTIPLERPPTVREGWAWAPDGRLAARSGADGLFLVDLASGGEVRLLGRPASQPSWVLTRR